MKVRPEPTVSVSKFTCKMQSSRNSCLANLLLPLKREISVPAPVCWRIRELDPACPSPCGMPQKNVACTTSYYLNKCKCPSFITRASCARAVLSRRFGTLRVPNSSATAPRVRSLRLPKPAKKKGKHDHPQVTHDTPSEEGKKEKRSRTRPMGPGNHPIHRAKVLPGCPRLGNYHQLNGDAWARPNSLPRSGTRPTRNSCPAMVPIAEPLFINSVGSGPVSFFLKRCGECSTHRSHQKAPKPASGILWILGISQE